MKTEGVRCNKCGKNMTNNNGKTVIGLSIKFASEMPIQLDDDFLQRQLGPFKLGKAYNQCYECWMLTNGFVP